jgi:hypothetical protein
MLLDHQKLSFYTRQGKCSFVPEKLCASRMSRYMRIIISIFFYILKCVFQAMDTNMMNP